MYIELFMLHIFIYHTLYCYMDIYIYIFKKVHTYIYIYIYMAPMIQAGFPCRTLGGLKQPT